MASAQSQPTVSLIAETTFSKSDLYKFVRISSSVGRVTVTGSSNAQDIVGTLLSETYSTSTGANETVTVGLLSVIGKVFLAGSTLMAGAPITASSLGYGVSPTTAGRQIGFIVATGSSGVAASSSTGRIASVLFAPSYIHST